jgi:hypothetical protein
VIKRFVLTFTSIVLIASFAITAAVQAHGRDRRAAGGELSSDVPDQVLAWNRELQTVLTTPGAQPASIHPTRTMAMTQIAVDDAVTGVLGDGGSLVVDERGPRRASPNAAAAAAAHTTLDTLLPSQQPAIDSFYATSLTQLGSSERVQRGLRFGSRVARAVVAARVHDGADAPPPSFSPRPGPGEYQLTPPAFAPAGFTQTAHVTPFVLRSAGQFRPAPPPALTSTRYAADFDEVHALGALNGSTRTADQTAIGQFWGAAPIWIVWNQIADRAAAGLHRDLAENARLFALLDTTLADGAVALYDAKYTYHRWRPITAITAQNQGNRGTTADPSWQPLATTANDPSYPGAHAEFSQAAATVLQDALGTDAFSFSLTNPTVGITRSFDSFSQAADEASASRIFAGQHFRYDEQAGQTLGSRVADFVVGHALAPSHRRRR